MKNIIVKTLYLLISFIVLTGCSAEIDEEMAHHSKGGPAEAYVSLYDLSEPSTRVSQDSYDSWSVATFTSGDKVGMYALKGAQNPSNEELFDQSVVNAPMNYDGRVGNYYKFNNPEIILDAETTHAVYSYMYYPYFEGMPSTTDSTPQPGIPLRQTDSDGIEKCIDFMSTLWMFNYTNYRYIPITNGMLQPQFYHHGGILGIQRGYGFDHPENPEIWIVCKYPYTDVRVYQDSYKATEYFRFMYQYNLPEGEDPMVSLNPDKPDQLVNKYRAWQCWEGNKYKEIDTYYAVLPTNQSTPYNAVSYILIQDNYGRWQTVSDFYLDEVGNKNIKYNQRYIVSVEMEGLKPTVKPVLIENWNEEQRITDDREVGIQTEEEFYDWVAIYNAYIDDSRNSEYEESLLKYGDAVSTGDGINWTFYINSDLHLETNGAYVINQLHDILEGSSVYTNYSISNLRRTLINEIDFGGEIHALDFDDLYIIDTEDSSGYPFTGGLVGKMTGGSITNVNVNSGILVTNKRVGMLVGSITGGTVSGCRLSGDVIGTSTDVIYPGIFGESGGSTIVEDCNTRDLYFIEN